MGSLQVTLTGSTPVLVGFDEPVPEVVVTIQSSPAEVYATLDGSAPVPPTSSESTGNCHLIPGVVGAQAVLENQTMAPPGAAGPPGMVIPTLRLASAGTPVVSVEW